MTIFYDGVATLAIRIIRCRERKGQIVPLKNVNTPKCNTVDFNLKTMSSTKHRSYVHRLTDAQDV